ncbi:SDR family NAD(P)-dependent oxidoreductase [Streptococcus fryi]
MKRCVFISGATSGIGKAMAYAFAKQGDNLILTGRRVQLLKEIKLDLETLYFVNVRIYELDVTDLGQMATVCQTILSDGGSIDILINNAGLALGLDKFQDSDLSDIMTMLDTNVRGVLSLTRLLLPSMVERNQGHIITIGSTAGIYAYAGAAVYSMTKAAVKTLSDGIRIDTIETNIKVTTVQPGIVETDFSQVRFHGDTERAANVYKGIEALKAEDIADIVCYIANQPKHVQISDITIMANQQATGFTIHREDKK